MGCPTCGVESGPCVTASGARARRPHAARDHERKSGQDDLAPPAGDAESLATASNRATFDAWVDAHVDAEARVKLAVEIRALQSLASEMDSETWTPQTAREYRIGKAELGVLLAEEDDEGADVVRLLSSVGDQAS